MEGCAGSGRTALLRTVLSAWQSKAPTVLVQPRQLTGDADSAVRPVLAAVLLGLSLDVPGYPISFERVLLAQIAIRTQTEGLDPEAALEELNRQTNNYRDRNVLTGLIRELFGVAGALIGPTENAANVINLIAEHVIGLLERSRGASRFRWSKDALDWFGHQDQKFDLDADLARLQLSFQARSENPDIRRDVDDLLVAALLADLRHSLARVSDRKANVLVLLDDGDSTAAMSFIGALLRVRQALADTAGGRGIDAPDPLTVVTTSGGVLAAELADSLPTPHWLDEFAVGKWESVSSLWVRVSSQDLSLNNVVQIAKGHMWPPTIAAVTVGKAVHKLTHGHPKAVNVVLRNLRETPERVHDLRDLLPGIDSSLLEFFVREFTAGEKADPELVQALITLSAARNRLEAQTLAVLLPDPIGLDSPLYSSPTLWSRGTTADQRLHPLARYLGMRALAQRAEDHDASWHVVLNRLRDHAGDRGARLRHTLLLGERERVAEELVEALDELPTEEWLELFDVVTSEVNPLERSAESIGTTERGSWQAHMFRLLGVVPAINHDPCVMDAAAVEKLCAYASHCFKQLADHAQDSALLVLLAQRYERHGRNRG